MKKTPLQRKTPLKAKKGLQAKSGLKRKRKVTKASLKRRKKGEWSTKTADHYFSLYVRERDGKCLKCGTKENLTCSHYHIRKHSATRFDPKNCIALCAGPYSNRCHESWEGPKNEYTQFMLDWLGQDEFVQLSLRAGLTVKRSDAVAEFKEFYQHYKSKV